MPRHSAILKSGQWKEGARVAHAIGSTGTPVSTPTPVPTNSAPTTFMDEMLDTATPDLLSCISQEGDAFVPSSFHLLREPPSI